MSDTDHPSPDDPTPDDPSSRAPAPGGGSTDPFAERGAPSTAYTSYAVEYALPSPRNGWKVATIVLSVILTFGIVLVGGLMVVGFVVISQETTSGELQDAVAGSCEDLAAAATDLDLLAGPDDVADGLGALATSARAVADDAGDAATDSSADSRFTRDATRLADALEAFADDPSAGLDVPTRADSPVTVLMSRAAPTCLIPPVVTALDPDAGDELYVEEPVPF